MNEKGKNITIEQLLLDESFVAWIRNGKPMNDPWHLKLEGDPSLYPSVGEAESLLQKLTSSPSSETRNPEQVESIWNRIDQTIEGSKAPSTVVIKPIWRRRSWIAAASFLVLVIASFFILQNRETRVLATVGEKIEHQLPDNSIVILNADSKISYQKGKFLSGRNVKLEGEAFFEVVKADDFIVSTPHGNVEVLGTSFNVFAKENDFRVECKTGKVKVTSKETGESQIITAGMSVRIDQNRELIDDSDQNVNRSDWLEGVFRFDDHELKLVFEELENQFDIQIETSSIIEQKTYTGSFDLSNLDTALYHVAWPMNLKVNEISEGKYQIVE